MKGCVQEENSSTPTKSHPQIPDKQMRSLGVDLSGVLRCRGEARQGQKKSCAIVGAVSSDTGLLFKARCHSSTSVNFESD